MIDEIRQEITSRKMPWCEPHTTALSENETLHEWWSPTRKVSLYEVNGEYDCLMIWGSNMQTEMEERIIKTSQEFVDIWKWLWRLK